MQNENTNQIPNTSQKDLSLEDKNGPNLIVTNVRSLSDKNTTSGEHDDMMSPPPEKKVKASESSSNDDPGKTSDNSEPLKQVTFIFLTRSTPLPSPVVNLGSQLPINDTQTSADPRTTTTAPIRNQLSICMICNNDLNPAKSPTLSARAQTKCQLINGVDPKVGDLLKWVVYDENLLQHTFHSLPPPPPKSIERRKLCSPCSTHLKNVYESVKKLRKAFNPEGYLGNYIMKKDEAISQNTTATPKYTRTVSTQTWSPLTKTKDVLSKPISAQIKESVKNVRQHTSFTQSVRKMLRQQMISLTKTNGLLNYTGGETGSEDLNFTQINKDLEIFVKTKCPLLWKVLLALFQRNYRTADVNFTMEMQIALGIAGRVHNQTCSRLQRDMAIFLWRNGASKNVIETLHGLGLSRSYVASLKLPEVKLIPKSRVKTANKNKENKKTLKFKSTKKIVRKYAGIAKNRAAKVKAAVSPSTKLKIKIKTKNKTTGSQK
ncbi:uncharacterized protein LOC110855755 isoform X1 [Folsomia candida]|uniref:Uncharacterized protein n=1 Tax=Folsomia candida TaxID=158441 RepID=A0A226EWS1_FOLCA|nr:uncharacterized protein LOC110855755 isoform X1 [Folsomia candida]OXA62042.1 hypothetical protein Fcan01_01192 [Folsomia candida]